MVDGILKLSLSELHVMHSVSISENSRQNMQTRYWITKCPKDW